MTSDQAKCPPARGGVAWRLGKHRPREATIVARRRRGSECRWSRVLTPRMEDLEDRTILSTVTWVGTNGGNWDTAANWSPAGVPTSGDSVVIEPSSAETIVHDLSQTDSVLSLTTNSNATLNLSGGSLNIGSGSSTLGGPVTVDSGASMNAGAGASVLISAGETLYVAGTASFAAGDVVTLNGGSPGGAAQITVAGTLSATGTTFTGTGSSNITVNSGGLVTPTGSTFNLPIFLPYSDVPSLANNVSFDQIEINPDTIYTGELVLNPIGTITANLSYVFPGGFTVGSAGALAVGMNVPVLVPAGETLTVNGTATFASGDMVTLNGGNSGGASQIAVAGTLSATGTTFTGTNGSNITVNSGGVINPTGSTFNLPILLPYNDVAYLANNNASFDQIEINPDTLSSGTLALNLIGTNTANLSYVFPGGFMVAGGALAVGMNVPVLISAGETLTVDGTATFATGDVVTMNGGSIGGASQIVVAGTLNATGTTFAGTDSSSITVNSGGLINPTGSTFNLPIFLPYNDVNSLTNNVGFDQIEINPGTVSGSELDLNLIGTDTANLSYVFPGGFTVGLGGKLAVGMNVPVLVAPGQTLYVGGTASFATDDVVTLNGGSVGGASQITVDGILNTTGTTFTGTDGSNITINSGGVINPTVSAFNLPVFLPYNDVPSLANNNVSFDQIEINPGTLSSGTLALNLIGTNTANLLYVFSGAFTVGAGGTLAVGPAVPVQVATGQTLSIDGTASFASGDTVSLSSDNPAAQITVGGILSATGTNFATTGSASSTPAITVDSGGTLNLSDSTYGVNQLVLNFGSDDTLHFNTFSGQLTINSGATIDIVGNDFSNVDANGIIATGSSTAHIRLVENYWGTTDQATIETLILDNHDDPTRPIVDFEPIWSIKSGTVASPVTVIFSSSSQNITLTAAVATTGGVPISGGTETFTILNSNDQQVGLTTNPATVANGSVSALYTLPPGTAVGLYTIEAAYSGDATYPAATDTSQFLTVTPLASQVAITSAALSMVAGRMGSITVQLEDFERRPGRHVHQRPDDQPGHDQHRRRLLRESVRRQRDHQRRHPRRPEYGHRLLRGHPRRQPNGHRVRLRLQLLLEPAGDGQPGGGGLPRRDH